MTWLSSVSNTKCPHWFPLKLFHVRGRSEKHANVCELNLMCYIYWTWFQILNFFKVTWLNSCRKSVSSLQQENKLKTQLSIFILGFTAPNLFSHLKRLSVLRLWVYLILFSALHPLLWSFPLGLCHLSSDRLLLANENFGCGFCVWLRWSC